jgi:hypothetical protein
VLNGYFSCRTYKMFKGVHWKRCTLLAMFLYPGMAFGIFLVINFLISGQHSSGTTTAHHPPPTTGRLRVPHAPPRIVLANERATWLQVPCRS